jgi:hypothetical protein
MVCQPPLLVTSMGVGSIYELLAQVSAIGKESC